MMDEELEDLVGEDFTVKIEPYSKKPRMPGW
jgi:hypothetical protein